MNNSNLTAQALRRLGTLPTRGNVANIFSFLASSVLPGLLAIYATSLYSHRFSPSEYGHYSLVLAVASPFLVLASQWLAQATTRFYHEIKARSEEHILGQVIAITNSIVVVAVVLVAITLYLFGIRYEKANLYYISGFAYLTTSIISTNIASYMVYSGKHHIYNLTMTIAAVVSFVFTILLLYHTSLGVSSLLLGTALSNVCSIAVFYNIAKIEIFPKKISNRSKSLLRQFAVYGIPLSFWMLMYSVINISDRYILQFFLGSGEVGRYSIHYSLVSLPFLAINSPITNIYSPKIMKAASENSPVTVRKYIKEATGIYVIIGLLAMSLAYRYGDSIPYIIVDRGYHIDKGFYLYIIAGFSIWSAAMFWHKPMEISKNTKTMLYYVTIAAVLNLSLNIIFVPRYGINAAAVSTLISFCFYAGFIFVKTRSDTKLAIDITQVLICIAASIITIYVSVLSPMKSLDTSRIYGAIISLLLFITIFLLVYAFATYTYSSVAKQIQKIGGEKNV